MKFGKRLKQQIEQSQGEWRDKFLCYKELKKLVKLISTTTLDGSIEAEFIYLLNHEIDKFNSFFMEQEEDFIIRHKVLQERVEEVIEKWSISPNGRQPSQPWELKYREEMSRSIIRKDIVNFHGEMVLLLNYSNINYTGLAKILKKYDKRRRGGGVLPLRMGFIQKVLEQPFFTGTDLISRLIKDCEAMDSALLLLLLPPPQSEEEEEDPEIITRRRDEVAVAAGEGMGIFRNTVAALVTMQEMRSGSSTYGQFSLPPLNLPDYDFIHSLSLAIS